MAEKIKVEVGWQITLIGPDGKELPEWYSIEEIIDNERLKIIGGDGVTLRIFKSRIANVVCSEKPTEKEEKNMSDNVNTETPVATPATTSVPTPAPATPASAPKAKAEKPEIKKPAPAKKEPKAGPPVLDLKAYCKEFGSDSHVLLKKQNEFKAKDYQSFGYVLINKEKHTYRCFNVYKYPSGVISLGRSGKGGNEYILEGNAKKVTTHKFKGKNGGEVSKVNRASLTVEALIDKKKKEGYAIVPNV